MSESQTVDLLPAGSGGSSLLDFIPSMPVICGLVALVAGVLRFQFSLTYPDYYADYDLYPHSVQLMTSFLVLVSWVAALAVGWSFFTGKLNFFEVFASGFLTFIFLFMQLVPLTNSVPAAHHRTADLNKLRQLSLGILNYESKYNRFPSAGAANGANGLSWRVHLLPFLEHKDLYQRFHLDEPWDSEHNLSLIDEMPIEYSSRSKKARLENGKTVFLCPVGNGAVFSKDGSPVRPADISDDREKTILIIQADPSEATVWTKPSDYNFDPADPLKGLGNAMPGEYFLASTCDGATYTFYTREIDAAALMTRAGNEPLDEYGCLMP